VREDRGQCGAIGGGVTMASADGGIADLDRAPSRCLSLGGSSDGVGEAADVMEHGGDLAVAGSEALSVLPTRLSTAPRLRRSHR
jgi:hypothetical protein